MENTTQQNIEETDWMLAEEQQLQEQKNIGEQLPSLVMEEGKVTVFSIDFSKPFEKWQDQENNVTKAIIPVVENGERKNWWLNTRNPTYAEVIREGRAGRTEFRYMRTGQREKTRYVLVKE